MNDMYVNINGKINNEFYDLTSEERAIVINLGIIGYKNIKLSCIKELNYETEEVIKKEYEMLQKKFENELIINKEIELKKIRTEMEYYKTIYMKKNEEIQEIKANHELQLSQNQTLYVSNIEHSKNINEQEKMMYINQIKRLNDDIEKNKCMYHELLDKERLEKKEIQNNLTKSLNSIQLLNNSSNKGKIGENQIEDILHNHTKGYNIENVSKKPHHGDYHIFNNKYKLMLEIKNYDSEKVRTSQIDKFYYDIDFCLNNGTRIDGAIFISMNNEIVGKKTLEFETYKNIPVMFISSLSAELDRLFCSINFIEKYIQIAQVKNEDNRLYLLNYVMTKLQTFNMVISDIENEKKYFDELIVYTKQKADKYNKEHIKNISFAKQLLLDIDVKINSANIELDTDEHYFMSINDPADISANMLQQIQKKYILNKFNNINDMSNDTTENKNKLTNTNTNEELNDNIDTNDTYLYINTSYNKSNKMTEKKNKETEEVEETEEVDEAEDGDTIKSENYNYENVFGISDCIENKEKNNNKKEKSPKKETIEQWCSTFTWLELNDENYLCCNICNQIFKSTQSYKKSLFATHSHTANHKYNTTKSKKI